MRIGTLLFLTLLFLLPLHAWGQSSNLERSIRIEKLNAQINSTEFDEISPISTYDGTTLYFTRVASPDFAHHLMIDSVNAFNELSYPDILYNLQKIYQEIGGGYVSDPIRSDLNQDVWIAKNERGIFDRIEHPLTPLNNALPNSICSLTPDASAFIIVNRFPKDGGMERGFSVIRQFEGIFQDPEPIEIEGFDPVSGKGISCTMSSDGNILIFSLSMPNYTGGDADLFISFKRPNGWSKPVAIPTLNTPYREITPHLSANGKEIYFASNRSGSMGGLDIFTAVREDETWLNWAAIRPLPTPVNSSADETHPQFSPFSGKLFFASKRDGSSDIFAADIEEAIEPSLVLRGKVINSATGEVVDDAVVQYGEGNKEFYENYVDCKSGRFIMRFKQGNTMKIVATKTGFISHELEVNFDKNTYFPTEQELILTLDPMSVGANISMKPIYFARSKQAILQESFAELDKLAAILKQYPTIKIKIEGHTDNQGNPKILQELSDARALEVKKYLISQGKIKTDRITTQGFGASKPISSNGTEEARRLNRRVEVKITKSF